ncbi:succinyl-diaminopimelate desuccinylase [Ectothiorhodospiraceae bacterium BW-2]|nr:succinyl-diaminopimelate desuccinylase [Ectothiorhodospiraceae bacterium BW-2]
MSPTLDLARQLVSRRSLTPDDGGCQRLLAERLTPLGFTHHPLPFGEVTNLWSRRGQSAPLFCFAGHTDVVPTGPIESWQHPPFEAVISDGVLHGRGSADMKGSLAAFITALERFIADHPDHLGSIALLITSDEEGAATHGTVKVIETLQQRQERIDWCLVGEPTSVQRLGDGVKNGRRGSLSGELTLYGTQGHVAYPHLADNPIHRAAPFLSELIAIEWDRGNDHFPPTTLQITHMSAGTGAGNVIPGQIEIDFNFRFSTEQSASGLQQRVSELLQQHQLEYDLSWNLSGNPFLTPTGELLLATAAAIEEICHLQTDINTAGGTSDGRFIAPTGAQVVELGPLNATIHKINEQVATADLEILSRLYQRILEKLLLP